MLIKYIWAYASFILATVTCVAATLWGGRYERIVAATFWISWALTFLVQSRGSLGPGDQVILIDSVVLIIFIWVSLKSRQPWVLLATASQVDDVASHLAARLLHFGLGSYIIATGIWGGYFITVCLAAGTIGYRVRLKRERNRAAA